MRQYIPRVSRRRITGMSNTIHTFMHALQVRWRVKLGCSLAICKSYAAPGPSPSKPWDGAISARVEGGYKHDWLGGSEEMSSKSILIKEASREQTVLSIM